MILCIDDEVQILNLMQLSLSKIENNMIIKCFECPMDAIYFFEQNHKKIKLVVSDYSMPMINGVELLSKLKKINSEIRMGISSSYVFENKLHCSHNPKDIDFLISKPFNISDFEKTINAQLER